MKVQNLLIAIPLSELKLQVATIDLQHSGRAWPTVTELGSFLLHISIGRHILDIDIITNLELVFEQSVNIKHLVEISFVHLSHH